MQFIVAPEDKVEIFFLRGWLRQIVDYRVIWFVLDFFAFVYV